MKPHGFLPGRVCWKLGALSLIRIIREALTIKKFRELASHIDVILGIINQFYKPISRMFH